MEMGGRFNRRDLVVDLLKRYGFEYSKSRHGNSLVYTLYSNGEQDKPEDPRDLILTYDISRDLYYIGFDEICYDRFMELYDEYGAHKIVRYNVDKQELNLMLDAIEFKITAYCNASRFVPLRVLWDLYAVWLKFNKQLKKNDENHWTRAKETELIRMIVEKATAQDDEGGK